MSSDSKLIKELRNKSKEAFSEIYYQYKNLLFYQAYNILNNKDDADDVVTDTYIKFIKNIDKVPEDTKIKSFLCTIAKNLALDMYRRNAKQVFLDHENVADERSETPNTETAINLINEVLEKEEANIVTLHVVYEYKFIEIATELNQTVGVVQAKYYKAMKKLKTYYSMRKTK